MLTFLTVVALNLPPTDPGLPTPPPPLPTYVTNGDGSRVICTPNYRSCWADPQQRYAP